MFQMKLNRAEEKQAKKIAREAMRNNFKKNFSVIAKSFQNIVQLSRNDVFKSTSLKLLKISHQSKVDQKIFELLIEINSEKQM